MGWHQFLLFSLLGLVAACGASNPDFCDEMAACDDTAAKSFCNISENLCVVPPSADACNRVEPCTDSSALICTDETAGVCVGCTSDMNCAGDQVCDLSNHTCLGCLTHADCSNGQLCDPEIEACVDCAPSQAGDDLCLDADSSFPFCNAEAGCVACVDSAQCTDLAASICDPVAFECVGCQTDEECDSGVCERSTGVCVAETDILYVDANALSDSGGCGTSALKCKTIGAALAKISQTRNSILIAAGTYAEQLAFTGTVVELISHGGTTINPNLSGAGQEVLDLSVNANVSLRGVDIAPATSIDGTNAILCVNSELRLENLEVRNAKKFGVNSSSCDVVIVGVTITDNTKPGAGSGLGILGGSLNLTRSIIADNQNGGITIRQADYSVTNTLILNNGALDGDTGGVLVEDTAGRTERFEFNTVFGSEVRSTSGRASGLHCPNSGLQASNNIIVEGAGAGTGVVVDTSCAHTFSLLEEVVTGAGNLVGDPRFVNELGFELQPTSPCIDKADPAATLDVDFGGESRPQGARRDIGADEAA